jgi:hypothetical protein
VKLRLMAESCITTFDCLARSMQNTKLRYNRNAIINFMALVLTAVCQCQYVTSIPNASMSHHLQPHNLFFWVRMKILASFCGIKTKHLVTLLTTGARIPLLEPCDRTTDVCNDTNAFCNNAVCDCRPGYRAQDLTCGMYLNMLCTIWSRIII